MTEIDAERVGSRSQGHGRRLDFRSVEVVIVYDQSAVDVQPGAVVGVRHELLVA
jgi:hypothetical protein